MYIVRLEAGKYLAADDKGETYTTYQKTHATCYGTYEDAMIALYMEHCGREFPHAEIEELA